MVTGVLWDELVATALVGTARRSVPPDVAPTLVERLGAAPDGPPEAVVLAAAAVLGAERRCGAPTPAADPTGSVPDLAPVDPRPLAPVAAVRLLDLLLAGAAGLGPMGEGTAGASLVAEWLDRAGATGRTLPRERVPALLKLATNIPDLRTPLLGAAGPVAAWLGARNDRWRWARAGGGPDGADADGLVERWRHGTTEERFAALTALRHLDPDLGATALMATWAGEKAVDRARALDVLVVGLGPADEEILELALDDRAATVRARAGFVLARLPTSARAARMADRLRPLVRITGRLRRALEVAYPDELDDAARRDGIGDGAPPRGIGPNAWRLTRIISAAPLATWTDHLGTSPGTVADLALAHPEVWDGLTSATILQRDATWAAALAGHRPTADLLALLPGDAARDRILRALRSADARGLPVLLAAAPGPWPLPFTLAIVDDLRRRPPTVADDRALQRLAAFGHPDAAPALEAWIVALGDDRRRRGDVRRVAHTLSLRRSIHQELP